MVLQGALCANSKKKIGKGQDVECHVNFSSCGLTCNDPRVSFVTVHHFELQASIN